ncbi:MAG: excinuclease ABC subunit UvrB [Spiroplasma poulsonii]|uniref:UvrABC system protein B n=1 Tax=Spiroplasma poulsonii TaxID=2138 RepID=A0A2P6FFK5_9MOLU|nr:excinuclease ABC subunit UvrB [Spiroplasma poulsonii]KAF0850058.1 UvrABC system protein B [Spiroplasma poulsonii]MBW1242354.1 excinuclease ABC subunit UvrB [Spiroplasma poulsonii]PQM32235.1 UvrABC system protein B [Spiroplasma poulsonii]PWF94885.1 UvrABC system protein B [Spiroplasma poulsonii]PWF97682.1 UvrABC system protein B [Spiroplasma poulsonii]
MFKLIANYLPAGDQPLAIEQLTTNLLASKKHQVLLGATGTGKTFTMANVIENYQKPTLVMAHNKTLAMQLYVELKEMFPENRVEYFVSNFDFYQPEAYVPSNDLYVDKDARQNMELDMMRLSAFNALTTRKDVIVVASVAAIYGAQDPNEYKKSFFQVDRNQKISKKALANFLVSSGYVRNDIELIPGSFSAKGDVIKIVPGWNIKTFIRIDLFGDEIEGLAYIDGLTGDVTQRLSTLTIFPAQDYITSPERLAEAIKRIEAELKVRLAELEQEGKIVETQRLKQRTEYDLDSLRESGICSGIENYSRHLDLRSEGEAPYTLIDFFGDDFLTIIDESHMSLPQIRAMYNTDRSRKETLVNYGFRLKSALDNRPLNFDEFNQKLKNVIYVSATPSDYELALVNQKVVEQIIRPTGLLDPTVEVKGTVGQIDDIIAQVKSRREKNERVFITTLTIRMSEDLTSYLQEQNVKVAYLHSELKTLERSQILLDLRKGVYDCIVGVNLIREGIDIPEVSLICILDADKQGFLRNERSLIQTIGRAARNASGHVILYADNVSDAMEKAMAETARRRRIQDEYNQKYHITPTTIIKSIRDYTNIKRQDDKLQKIKNKKSKEYKTTKEALLHDLRKEMYEASEKLDFERAAELRDIIIEIEA